MRIILSPIAVREQFRFHMIVNLIECYDRKRQCTRLGAIVRDFAEVRHPHDDSAVDYPFLPSSLPPFLPSSLPLPSSPPPFPHPYLLPLLYFIHPPFLHF
ncbi:hypothetical protein JAAARDRAFT_72454, partial [Jaapia argillacea MUCL 33604]